MQSSAEGEQGVGFYNQQSADIVSETAGEPSVLRPLGELRH